MNIFFKSLSFASPSTLRVALRDGQRKAERFEESQRNTNSIRLRASSSLLKIDFFGLNLGGSANYHFLINSNGVSRDEHIVSGHTNVSWNKKWKCKTSRNNNQWVTEVAIPWRSLNLATPPKHFRANFCRQAVDPTEASAWSCTYGPFNNYARWGIIHLK